MLETSNLAAPCLNSAPCIHSAAVLSIWTILTCTPVLTTHLPAMCASEISEPYRLYCSACTARGLIGEYDFINASLWRPYMYSLSVEVVCQGSEVPCGEEEVVVGCGLGGWGGWRRWRGAHGPRLTDHLNWCQESSGNMCVLFKCVCTCMFVCLCVNSMNSILAETAYRWIYDALYWTKWERGGEEPKRMQTSYNNMKQDYFFLLSPVLNLLVFSN